jgi:LPXTG-site transpeptidase (sortase) family protein
MAETRTRRTDDNVLHIAEVTRRRSRRSTLQIVVIAILLIPVLAGLIDLLSRAAALFDQARAAGLEVVQTPERLGPGPGNALSTTLSFYPEYEAAAVGIEPVRLRIPSLGVDARVENVGVTAEGFMQAPASFKDAGWYKDGSRPGAEGSAVFDGHVNNGLTTAGVFEHLGQIQAGDTITVSDADGQTRTFRVTDSKVYEEGTAPSEEIFSRAGPPRLVLITCDGDWDRAERQYTHRLVVYAELSH